MKIEFIEIDGAFFLECEILSDSPENVCRGIVFRNGVAAEIIKKPKADLKRLLTENRDSLKVCIFARPEK